MINVSIKKDNIKNKCFLKPKEFMHRDFWDEKVLLPEVSEALLRIADSILKNMEIEAKIKDIIVTGSIAGYNWHPLSDIDLHIVFDFQEIDENFELVKRMLDQSRINWNKAHDIKIKGHEVELYFQDANEPHESKGIWSLTKNLWNVEPVPQKGIDIDLRNAEKKAETLAKAIEHLEEKLEEDPEGTYRYASKIKNKVSEMRSAGLSREGVYSPENLAFKMLRNSNYLERLSNIKINSYDKMLSLNEMYIKDYFSKRNESDYLEFEGRYNLEDLLDPDGPAPWGKIEKQKIKLKEQEGDPSYDRRVPYEEPTQPDIPDQESDKGKYALEITNDDLKSLDSEFDDQAKELIKVAGHHLLDLAGMFFDASGQYTGRDYKTGRLNPTSLEMVEISYNKMLNAKGASNKIAAAVDWILWNAANIPVVGAGAAVMAKSGKTFTSTTQAARKSLEAVRSKSLQGQIDKLKKAEQLLATKEKRALKGLKTYVQTAGVTSMSRGLEKRTTNLLLQLLNAEKFISYNKPVYRGLRAKNLNHFQQQLFFENEEVLRLLTQAYKKALTSNSKKWTVVDLSGKGVSILPKGNSGAVSYSKSERVAKGFSDFRMSISHRVKQILGLPLGNEKMRIVVVSNPQRSLDVGETLNLKKATEGVEMFMSEQEVLVIGDKIPIEKIMFLPILAK